MQYALIKQQLEKSIQRYILTATLMGLVPFKSHNKTVSILTMIYFVFNTLVLCIVCCQLIANLVTGPPKDVNMMIEIILNIEIFFSAFVLMIMYKVKMNSLNVLTDLAYGHFRFHSQYSAEVQCSIEPSLNIINIIVPIFIVCTYASSYQWLVLPIFFTGPNGRRLLPIEMPYPYPAHDSPYYEITYIIQAYLCTLLALVYSHVNASYTTLTALLCTQYDILYCNIRLSASVDGGLRDVIIPTLSSTDNTSEITPHEFMAINVKRGHFQSSRQKKADVCERSTLKAIADCVEMHVQLRRFCQELKNYYNMPFSFQLLMVVVTMGCAVISFMQKFAMNTLQFTMISLAFLSILCYQGQQILHKSGSLHEAVWLSRWQRHGVRVRRAYMILLQQALVPGGMVVGYGLFELNLSNLISILRASFSFFTLLDNMIKPDK